MSLRVRLFLLLAGLLALLMGAQWWLIRSLSRELGTEVSAVAFSVGQELVELLQDEILQGGGLPPAGTAPGDATKAEVDVRVIHIEENETVTEGDDHHARRIVHFVRAADSGPLSPRELAETTGLDLIGEEGDGAAEAGAAEPGAGAVSRQVEILRLGPPGSASLVVKGPGAPHRIPIPLQSFEQRLESFQGRLLAGTLVLLTLGLALAALVAHRVSEPLRSLAAAAQKVGEGELGARVPERAGGEIGATLRAFNLMSGRLARLEQSSRRLREAQHLSELGEVSRGFAHSLRNPLNALGLSVETLAEGELEEDRRQGLAATARQQIRRVDAALRSFLALASSGGAPEEVDVGALLQDVALEAIQDCRGRRSGDEPAPRLEVRPAPGLPPLTAVAPELRAVLQALVVNAVEASPAGGRVRITAQGLDEGRLQVLVEDDGPGLPPEVRRRLFTPHVTTKAHGSGMGLFLAHRIATSRYGGSLHLEDAEPTGTRAILELGSRLSSDSDAASEEDAHG
jgi:signal transduction histidine kinase